MAKTTYQDIETLYYFLDMSVIKGEADESKMYLEILRDEYEENEDNFDVLKEDKRFEHLQKLSKVIENNLVVRSFDFTKTKEEIVEKDDQQIRKEKELVLEICKNQDVLRKALNVSKDFIINSCWQKVMFGEVDIVAQDKEAIYIIETKKNIAKHDVIAQIEKYLFDFKLKMILKLWKSVIGIVIANGYDKYTLKELKKTGTICLKYKFQNKKLELEKI